MAFPADQLGVVIEIYVDGGWVDITDDVLVRDLITISRGRGDESGTVGPSSCSLTLKNPAGTYTPRNPASPYYGLLGKNTPLRVKILHSAVLYTRFYGFVSEWPPRWDLSHRDEYVPLVASGVLRRLGQGAAPLRSALTRYIAAEADVVAYWPMEDDAGALSFGEASGGLTMRFTGEITAGGGSEPGLSGSAPLAKVSATTQLVGAVPAHSTTDWTVSAVMFFPTAMTDFVPILRWRCGGTITQWRLLLGPDSLSLQGFTADGTNVVNEATAWLVNGVIPTGHWVQVTAAAEQDGANIDFEFYMHLADGSGSGISADTVAGTIGVVRTVEVPVHADLVDVSVGHVVARDTYRALFGGNAHVQAMNNEYGNGEYAVTRLDRVCDEEGLPLAPSGASFDTLRSALMGGQPIATLLDLLRDCETTDGGILYEDRAGAGLIYMQQFARYNRAVALALNYETSGHVAPPMEPTDDDQRTRNDVTATRSEGGSARYVDEASVTAIGRYDDSVTVNVFGEDPLIQQAAWRVHLGTVDELRFPAIGLNLAAGPSLITGWLGCDVGSRITVANPPAGLPPDLIDLHIEGYTEVLGMFGWDVVVNCSPARPWTVIKLDDATLGRLDTSGSTLASGVTSTATSLSVATTIAGDPLWVTAGGEFPFDIEIGGERLTVSAISGASSPQTFTVTRSVNTVVKAHDAGAAVAVWEPAVLALQ